jgi:hypothetical protein
MRLQKPISTLTKDPRREGRDGDRPTITPKVDMEKFTSVDNSTENTDNETFSFCFQRITEFLTYQEQ